MIERLIANLSLIMNPTGATIYPNEEASGTRLILSLALIRYVRKGVEKLLQAAFETKPQLKSKVLLTFCLESSGITLTVFFIFLAREMLCCEPEAMQRSFEREGKVSSSRSQGSIAKETNACNIFYSCD